MFERFTDNARRAVVHAQEEARLLDHAHIGTEHLLLGLVHDEDGLAGQVLGDVGVTLDRARTAVREHVGPGPAGSRDRIPFTDPAKKAMEQSLRESLALGDKHIGTEHLLLGLLAVGDSVALELLGALGVEADSLRRRVLTARGQPGRPVEPLGPEPRCRQCGGPLVGNIGKRTVEAEGEQVTVWFCTTCGVGIGTTPA